MKIAVCLGNVPDTTTKVKFVDGISLDKTGVQWIINPWDEASSYTGNGIKRGCR